MVFSPSFDRLAQTLPADKPTVFDVWPLYTRHPQQRPARFPRLAIVWAFLCAQKDRRFTDADYNSGMITATPCAAQRIAGQHVNFMLVRMNQVAAQLRQIMQGPLTDGALDESRILMAEWRALSAKVRTTLPKVWGG